MKSEKLAVSITPLEIIIVGAGMYVCGKGTDGYGTILPAVFEAYRAGLVKKIHLAAATHASAEKARRKAVELKEIMQVEPEIVFYPAGQDDKKAYLAACQAVTGPCAAIVSVPDHLHFEITGDLIRSNVHVQVVKPLVPTVKEAIELIDLQKKHNVYGAVEFHKRFDESNLKLRDLISENKLGDLLNFRINYSQRKVIPTKAFCGWVDNTDVFQYLGVHYVDLIHFLTDAQPKRVMSIGMKKYLISEGIDNYDTIQTLIEWQQPDESTFLSSHLTGWIDPDSTTAMSDQRIEVIGTKGRYRADQKDRGVSLVTDEEGVEQVNPYFTQFYPALDGEEKEVRGYGPKSIMQFLRDARQVVRGEKTPEQLKGLRATFESSLPVVGVLEASRESLSEENHWVSVGRIMKGLEI